MRTTCSAYSTALLFAVVAFLVGSCRPGDQFARDILSHTAQHPASLYESAGDGAFYTPFNLFVQPMEALILVNIEQDPDSLYVGFEPQLFDDPAGGTGMLVIAYRADGRVDVYHQPGVHATNNDYSIVGQGLAHLVERDMDDAYFSLNPVGIDLYFAFADIHGRSVAVSVRENASRAARPFGLLAPLGSGTAKPPYLPVFLMHDFYFLRRKGTEYEVRIDGRSHKLDRLPLPLDRQRMLFTRYSPDPLIVGWNADKEGPLDVLASVGATLTLDGATYDLALNDGHPEIASMRAGNERREVAIHFRPAFPNVASLRDRARAEGRFVIAGDPTTGFISGTYTIERTGRHIDIAIHPAGGWTPNERRLTLRFIYTANRWFRTWPADYEWTARISRPEAAPPTIVSGWSRYTAATTP